MEKIRNVLNTIQYLIESDKVSISDLKSLWNNLSNAITNTDNEEKQLKNALKTAIKVYKEYGIKPAQNCYKQALKLVGEICESCDGDGYLIESCCGDNIKGNDIDLCPTCGEHCGDEQFPCPDCNGIGNIIKN